MEAIVAVYADWGIGAAGTQQIVIPEDRKRFRELTEGATIVVGRKTLEDFPGGKPLPNRRNVVLSSQKDLVVEGADVVHSVEELLETVKDDPRVFVVGGASVYNQLLPYCDRIYITRIYETPKSDAFFRNLDEDFNWTCEEFGDAKFHEGIKYRFSQYDLYDLQKIINKGKK
ncbi:MAG: dihydrofolate reductase [Bacillota bacterium]